MKKLYIKHLSKKYNLKKEFIKRILKNDFKFIDIIKINYYLRKGVRKNEKNL